MEINLKKKKKHWLILISFLTEKNNAIKFVGDYGSMILEAKRKTAEEESKPEPPKAKTERKKSLLELHEKFIKEIKNDEKNINEQIFKEFLLYHTPLFLAKELYNNNQNTSDEIVKYLNDALIEFKKDINRKNS